MTKIQLTPKKPIFNLKFLLVGASGVGKTHLCGTYTKGPIHFYTIDPGGEKTLDKLLSNRPANSPITIDKFSLQTNTYSDIWRTIQKDAKEGFFEEMYQQNGLVVLPDSLTTMAILATEEIARKNKRTLNDITAPMRIQDWGVLGAWMKTLVATINDIPCATVTTAHLHIDHDDEGAIVSRTPLIPGKIKYHIGLFFDEVYLLETQGNNYVINFKNKQHFQAKTRTFPEAMVKNATMDHIAEAYMHNKTLTKVIQERG